MKKRFANSVNEEVFDYNQIRVDEKFFKGYACILTFKEVKNPWIVENAGEQYCILNDKYKWLEIYPDDEKYAITAMFDENGNLIEWYFDMVKSIGVEENVPYIEDLYLDLIIRPDGKQIVLDADELLDALNENKITKEDYNMAYETMKKIIETYGDKINKLQNLTNFLIRLF